MYFVLFPFSFSCFEHIESLPFISWFWKFYIPIWPLPVSSAHLFLEVICPRYGPDTIIINWNMRNICTHSWCLLCMVFFPALAYTSHESHVMLSANIRYIYTSTCWITEEEVYFKSILFWQKKSIWSAFCEIKLVFLM